MTKRKWREELKRREIAAHRRREVDEMNRRRLIGVKNVTAAGHDANVVPVRSVFVLAGEPSR